MLSGRYFFVAEILFMMEDRKSNNEGGSQARVIGSKVSQIANIFQCKGSAAASVGEPELLHVSHKLKRDSSVSPKRDQKEVFRDAKIGDTISTQITVVRTESHVARFNSAKALFEKLGTSKCSRNSARWRRFCSQSRFQITL